MHCNNHPFFGVVSTPLVRHGVDYKLDRIKGVQVHTRENVYTEMVYQICRDYASLPDIRSMTCSEIRFFYDGLRPELKHHTKKGNK